MSNFRKKRIIILTTVLIIAAMVMTTTSKISAFSDSTHVDPFILMEYNPNDLGSVASDTIIDNENRVHFFLQLRYYNGTFVILHIIEDVMIEVDRGKSYSQFFQAYIFGDNVSLVYHLEDQIYRNAIKMYVWNNETGHSVSILYTNNASYFYPKIILEDQILHILVTDLTYADTRNLNIDHTRVHLNGTIVDTSYFIIAQIDEYEVFVVQNQLFAYLKSYNYNETIGYTESATMMIVGVTDDGYYNSSVYEVEDSWFWSQVSITSDEEFYLTYVSYGILYAAKFAINETLTPSSFKELNFGSYYYYGMFEVFSYTNITYIIYQEPSYYWLESIPYYYDPYQKTKTLKLHVIEDVGGNLIRESLLIEDYPYEYQFGSVSFQIMANGSYSILYSTILESTSFPDKRFLSDYVFGWKVQSDLELNLPKNPILFGIKSVTPFVYFWIKYWYTVVSPILVLSLIYVIFRKRIHRGIRKMVRFLTRPIIPGAKKAKLVAVNFWLFIKNSSSLIFILWKANKRRLIISLLGLTILSTIIVTSTTLFDSKRASLITNYVESADVYNDNNLSLHLNLNLGNSFGIENDPVNPNITDYAFAEIFHTINTQTSVVKNIIRAYYYSHITNMRSLNFTFFEDALTVKYIGIQNNYTEVINELLTEGRLPEQKNEILISSSFQSSQDIQVNDVLSFNVSSYEEIDTNKTHNLNLTVVGFYQEPTSNLITNICSEYSLPSDPLYGLISYYYDSPSILTFTDNYFENLENVTVYNLLVNTAVQLVYDFSNMDTDRLTILLEEMQELTQNSPYTFNFNAASNWFVLNEIGYVFSGISEQMQITQFIVVFLSIPILYLALFVTFEVNELFSSSFEQEIRIMSSKGVSTGMITFLYSTMKFFEALVATFLGLGVNLILLPPLLRVDKFISFKSVFTSIELGTAPASMGITMLLLILIALPRIIKLSKTKQEVEKPPKKYIQLMKNIRLPYILLIVFGGGLMVLGYWLIQSSYNYIGADLTILTVYIYIIGIGIMIALLGIGLLVRDLHKIFMIAISKVSWLIKKNFFTFSLVQVRSDIDLFNNTFLTYVILIGLLIPFTMTPLLLQDKVNTQSYFYGGSDLIVNNWDRYNDSVLAGFDNYDEIVGYTNITHLEATYRYDTLQFLILNDSKDYLDTAYKPPKYLTKNWEDSITNLGKNTSMLTSNPFKEYVAGGNAIFNFVNDTAGDPEIFPFTIESTFDYFPIFYDKGPIDRYYYYTYYIPDPYDHFGIVMSQSNFEYIYPLLSIERVVEERLLINIRNTVDQEEFADELSKDLGLEIRNMNGEGDLLIFALFPFYSVLVAEFVFGILICFAAVAFTSLSNPLKILQKRLVKHDILKKIGIPTNRIILLSALELFISCIIPGLILGGAAGYGLLRLFNWLFIDSMSGYGGLPFKIFFPYQVALLIFVAIPVIFYTIFFIAMKYNFAKYRPKNLE